jgi:Protein tyrosine and serine/threonine kinase
VFPSSSVSQPPPARLALPPPAPPPPPPLPPRRRNPGAALHNLSAEQAIARIANSKPVGSNITPRNSSLSRCESNIAVADLDETLRQAQREAASHDPRLSDAATGYVGGAVASSSAADAATVPAPHVAPVASPPLDLAPLRAGEWLLYYSSASMQRYRFKFRVSDDGLFLSWEGKTLRLADCVGVLFGPQSATFRALGQGRVDPDWLCFSIVSFPRADKPAHPTTVDLVCESDNQLTSWLFGLQSLCGRNTSGALADVSRSLYSYEAILMQRLRYKVATRAHDRGLTTRQYVLKKVRKCGERVGRDSELNLRDVEVSELEAEVDLLRKRLRKANARETVLATKLHTLQADWDVTFEELSLTHVIGRGAYSEMWRGTWRSCAVAVKVLKAPDTHFDNPAFQTTDLPSPYHGGGGGLGIKNVVGESGGGNDRDFSNEHRHLHEFHDEVVTLSKLRHPNIVLFMAACAHPPNLCIVTEFCHGGTLFNALRRRSWRDHMHHTEFLSVARDAARGMLYLHDSHIIHRDFKSQNLLLDRPVENGCPILKIADFGLSRDFRAAPDGCGADASVAGVMTSETGTYRFMSPEVMRHEPYSRSADLYSYGVTLWEMFSCEIPHAGMTPIQAAFAVADKGLRPTAVSEYARANPIPPSWMILIEHCWAEDPHARPRFSDVLVVLDEMEKHGPHIVPSFWAKWNCRDAKVRRGQRVTDGDNGRIGGTGAPANIGYSLCDAQGAHPTALPPTVARFPVPATGPIRHTGTTSLTGHSGSAPNLQSLRITPYSDR